MRWRGSRNGKEAKDRFVLTDGAILVPVQFRRSSEQGLNVR